MHIQHHTSMNPFSGRGSRDFAIHKLLHQHYAHSPIVVLQLPHVGDHVHELEYRNHEQHVRQSVRNPKGCIFVLLKRLQMMTNNVSKPVSLTKFSNANLMGAIQMFSYSLPSLLPYALSTVPSCPVWRRARAWLRPCIRPGRRSLAARRAVGRALRPGWACECPRIL